MISMLRSHLSAPHKFIVASRFLQVKHCRAFLDHTNHEIRFRRFVPTNSVFCLATISNDSVFCKANMLSGSGQQSGSSAPVGI